MNQLVSQYHALLERKMSRRQFLAMLGIGILFLLNIEPLLRFLTNGSSSTPGNNTYGNSNYNGHTDGVIL